MKFAVILILVFGLCMISGTLLESYFGTDFANRILYKSPFFIFLQFLLFTSILLATLKRLPFRKKLGGFYILHLGLLLIGAGSFVTWIAGIDGNITLYPRTFERNVLLNQDQFIISYPEDSKRVTRKLPHKAFPLDLSDTYEKIHLKKYFPFAEEFTSWKKDSEKKAQSSEYFIANPNVSQNFILSLHPDSLDFSSSLTLGPLKIHYLPFEMTECFLKMGNEKIFLWNEGTKECHSLEILNIKLQKTNSGHRFFALNDPEKGWLSYFPDVSPFPIDEKFSPITDSHLKVFGLKMFENGPELFLFGPSLSYFDKVEKKWVLKEIEKKISLPWMNFTLELKKHSKEEFPQKVPRFTFPLQQKGQLKKGDLKALVVEIEGEEFYVTNRRPLDLRIDNKKVRLEIAPETFRLPYEVLLEKFEMKTNPGSNMPASYESFVRIFSGNNSEKAHIFMNNPLKKEGITLYQASYQQDPESGQYISTLSVNVDPGRMAKYLGSLLLVIGSIIHFAILNRPRKVVS